MNLYLLLNFPNLFLSNYQRQPHIECDKTKLIAVNIFPCLNISHKFCGSNRKQRLCPQYTHEHIALNRDGWMDSRTLVRDEKDRLNGRGSTDDKVGFVYSSKTRYLLFQCKGVRPYRVVLDAQVVRDCTGLAEFP